MKIKKIIQGASFAGAFLYLMWFPQETASAIRQGFNLCIQTVIPAMFPYFILSDLFISTGSANTLAQRLHPVMQKIFGIGGNGASPLLLGLIGGYPTGARIIAELYRKNQLSEKQAHRLLSFCCNAGPAFLVGVVGGSFFCSPIIGVSLYGIHIVSAILCGIVLNFKTTSIKETTASESYSQPKSIPDAIVQAVTGSMQTCLHICGFIMLFTLVISVEQLLLPSSSGILMSLTEISSGCSILAKASLSWPEKYTLISGIVSFGGLCVLCQTMSVLSGTGLKIRPYFLGKILHSIISAAMAYPVSFLLQPYVSAGAFPEKVLLWSPLSWKIIPCFLLILFFLQFPSSFSARRRL